MNNYSILFDDYIKRLFGKGLDRIDGSQILTLLSESSPLTSCVSPERPKLATNL